VHDDPTHSPSGNQEALGQSTAGKNWNLSGQAAHSQVFGAGEHKVLVDLQRDYNFINSKTKKSVVPKIFLKMFNIKSASFDISC